MTTHWLESGVREIDGSGGPGGDSQKREQHLEGPSGQGARYTFEELRKGQCSWPKSQHAACIKDFWSLSQLKPLGDCKQRREKVGSVFEGLL